MISYREWTKQDTAELKRQVAALHDSMRPYDENYPPAEAIIDEYFDFLVSEVAETSGTVFLAEDDGRIIGFACVFGLMTPFSPDEDPRELTFISDLYVDAAYQGQGIGTALIERAEAFAKSLGTPRIELAAHAANPAMALYTRLGYRQRMVIMTKRLDR
ncbi:MAG: GNAT family N-acetyltransferase [Armatimonadota bacterium]